MLTDKDIDKLMKVFPTKDEVSTIVDKKIAPVLESQKKLLTGLDKLATAIEKQNMGNASRDIKLSRHDGWIHKIAKDHELPVIEDAAHALTAKYKGNPIGSISDFTAFSFQAIKQITTIDGGM